MPAPQTIAPITLYRANTDHLMRAAPATIGAIVRTIGTKRARKMVIGPCLSKKSWASVR